MALRSRPVGAADLDRMPVALRELFYGDARPGEAGAPQLFEIYVDEAGSPAHDGDPAKQGGPAEGATSPSHGSNDPHQETAVNRKSDTSAGPHPASPNYFKAAFHGLEDKISRVQGFAQALSYLVLEDFSVAADGSATGRYVLGRDAGDIIKFLAFEMEKAADDLNEHWLERHNANADHECAVAVSKAGAAR